MPSNRDYIDRINDILQTAVDEEVNKNGYVTREFFEDADLKHQTETKLQVLEIAGYPKLNQNRFSELFVIAIRETRHNNSTSIAPSISLKGEKTRENHWLTSDLMDQIGWTDDYEIKTYRTRYMEYLRRQGRSDDYIEETKRSSLEIVRKLGNPKDENPFYVRGLVVGSVQSGKTANFNAVINSAIDVGYGLIIVLSGIMEDLRQQTQARIEKEVDGKIVDGKFTGVGAVKSFGPLGELKDVPHIILPTSTAHDFKKTLKEQEFSLQNKNVLVCKKNTGVLKNLILWLDNYLNEHSDKITVPLLIVDDEADNASLNNLGIKGKNYASKINGHIRALLALFRKKTYLGYTATPFGNVLQDRNEAPDEKWMIKDREEEKFYDQVANLFPKDFIELLFPPSNYIGAKHFFETRLSNIRKIEPLVPKAIDDYVNAFPSRLTSDDGSPTVMSGPGTRAVKKEDEFPTFLPESLKDAIMCFVISTAIRISRKEAMFQSKLYQPHNTMLIHISRFTPWQTRTKKLVQEFVDELKDGLVNHSPSHKNSVYAHFEKTWNVYYAYIMSNIRNYLPDDYEDEFLIQKTFGEISPLLYTAIKDVEVKAINSETKEKLVYPDDAEKKYIAVGGNRLSRGFTLEGLTINYFIRNTNYADTLLQMGRWFGYRPGYIDCCKLFTTRDALEKFDQTTVTIDDLEQRFIEMNRDPKNTPDKYALKVLTNPDVVKLTRDNILKNAETVKLTYSDHLIQTTKFIIDNTLIKEAWEGFVHYVNALKDRLEVKKDEKGNAQFIEYRTNNIHDVLDFLHLPATFNIPVDNPTFALVEQFLLECQQYNKLTNWSIAIKVTGKGKLIHKAFSGLPIDIETTERKGPKSGRWFDELKQNRIFAAGGSSANIFGGGQDMQIRLEQDVINNIEKSFLEKQISRIGKENPYLSEEEILKRARKVSIPEKLYRNSMSDQEAVLVIYLLDLAAVFNSDDLEILALQETVNTDYPLIGYALGIPEIDGDIGGIYMENVQEDVSVEEEASDNYDDVKDVLENDNA
jgi:hypothetical protein